MRRYEGTFPSEFRERLLFTKGTFQPRAGQLIDVSYGLRNESDVRSFGNQTSFEAAENVRQRVDTVLGRWTLPGSNWLNELTMNYQRFNWNPEPANPTLVGTEYMGVIRAGGRETTQDFVQQRTSLRDDVTRFLQWKGSHTLKGGAVISFLKYEATKFQFGNPLFTFRSDTAFAFPSEARYGFGQPTQSDSNTQFGWFVQDDWAISPRLTLNAGLRWDVESNMLNNDYETPADVQAWATNFGVNPASSYY